MLLCTHHYLALLSFSNQYLLFPEIFLQVSILLKYGLYQTLASVISCHASPLLGIIDSYSTENLEAFEKIYSLHLLLFLLIIVYNIFSLSLDQFLWFFSCLNRRIFVLQIIFLFCQLLPVRFLTFKFYSSSTLCCPQCSWISFKFYIFLLFYTFILLSLFNMHNGSNHSTLPLILLQKSQRCLLHKKF